MAHATHRAPRRRWDLVGLGLSLLFLVGCSAPQPVLSGRVSDAASGAALVGARVVAGEAMATTDAEGEYALALSAGVHQLDVSASGYITQELAVTVEHGAAGQGADVALERRRLVVHLVDVESAVPLAGARAAMGDSEVTSDAQGIAVLEAHQSVPLAITYPGYLPLEVPPDEIEAAFAPSGALAAPLTLSLAPRVLEGVVTLVDSGAPVAGATVAVGDAHAMTDAQGRYRLARIEPGAPMAVQGPAHRPVEGLTYEGQERQDVALEPWMLTVTVTDAATGEPLAGATVASGKRAATSDASGEAQLQPDHGTTVTVSLGGGAVPESGMGVSPMNHGRATLTPMNHGRATLTPMNHGQDARATLTTVTVSLDGYAPAELAFEGQDSWAVALTRARLEGRLRNKATGAPLARARVLVYREGVELPEVVAADAEGHVVVEDSRGVSRLLIKAPGHRVYEAPGVAAQSLDVALEPFDARGIYIPFMLLALPDRIDELLTLVEDSPDLNAVVIDVKGDRARLAWQSEVPLAQEIGAYHPGLMDLGAFLKMSRDRDIYVIARMVMFKDEELAKARPEWAAAYADGRPYVDLEGLRWVDPFRREVRDYNLDLAREVALMGFDEIQLDYVRFPSDGSTRGLTFSQESTLESRCQALAEFSAEMAAVLAPTPAFLSADIFGLVVWLDPARDMGIGQRLDDMAPHMDFISPMLYPTTFGPGNLGYQNPGLYPYEVIYRSVRKTQERTDTLVRPWLQHYSIGGINYGMVELLKQKKAAEDRNSSGWLFWNSRGRYERELFMEGTQERYADQLPSPEQLEAE